MHISNVQNAAPPVAGLPRQNRAYDPAPASIAHEQEFSEAVASKEKYVEAENAADAGNKPASENKTGKKEADRKKRRTSDVGGPFTAAIGANATVDPIGLRIVFAEVSAASPGIGDGGKAGGAQAGAGKAINAAAVLSGDAMNVLSEPRMPADAAGAVSTGPVSRAPKLEIPQDATPLPSETRANGVDIVSKPANSSHAATITPPPASPDLQTLADAFETSVRHFERAGANWVGGASFTLQSSALKGASFQLLSDGRSLRIQLTQMAAASMPISRREESRLGEILTRKLGRDVHLNLGVAEIEAAEETEQAEEQ